LIPAPDASQVIQINPFFDYHVAAAGNKNVVHHQPADEVFPFQGVARTVHLVRLITVAFGALTIVGVFELARAVFPGRRRVAVLAAGFCLLNPEFLFLSGTITNDLAIAATSTWSLVLLVPYLTNRPTSDRPAVAWKGLALLGFVLGLALLSKATAFGLLLLVFLSLFAFRRPGSNWRISVAGPTAVAALALLIGGWWYVRLWLLYHDPLGTVVRSVGLGRTTPFTFDEAVRDLGELAVTFVARFGNSNVAPSDWITTILLILCLGGLLLGALQVRLANPGYRVNLLWIGLILILFYVWQLQIPGSQGRLVFPAIGSLALVWGLGVANLADRLAPWVRRISLVSLGSGALAICLALPVAVIRPAYSIGQTRLADRAPSGLTRVQAAFGEEATLVGYSPLPDGLRPGDRATVTLVWQIGPNPSHDLRFDVHAVDHTGTVVAATDAPLAPDIPLSAWPTGQFVEIQQELTVPPNAPAPQLLRLEVGVYFLQNEQIQHVAAQPGSVDAVGLGTMRVEASERTVGWLPLVRFGTPPGDQIALAGWSIDQPAPAPGGTVRGRLIWQVERPPAIDYTVFVQVLRNGKLVAQTDAQPRAGAFPTTAFRPGQTVPDSFALALPSDLSPGPAQLIVGLYDVKTLARLPIPGGDAWPVTTLDIIR
jgi:4-amino-4-deoxy-L-arabinose transferase-like glycosyltransferase